MRITIKLFATHRTGRFKEKILEYPFDAPVAHVAASLGIAPESMGIALLNGYPATLQLRLQDGDTLAFFPNVAGG
jgi:molybdopterin converting factor small subunit